MKRAYAMVLLAGLLLASCTEHERVSPSSYPSAGLYTPGSTLGASDPTDKQVSNLGNRCVSLPTVPAQDGGVVGTAGTLTLEYMTQTMNGYYAPKNCTAVWLETMSGQYVTTIELRAGIRRYGLVYWEERACTDKPGPDAVAMATLRTHDTKHVVDWTGLDFEGKGVPDGTYKLHVEVTETDVEPGELTTFEITKGPMPYSMPLPVAIDGPIKEATITWAPE